MKVLIGSRNPTKINAVKHVFEQYTVEGIDSPSKVSNQPTTDEETILGAINRAKFCHKRNKDVLSIGLEGGVMLINEELYLCNWGVLISPGGKVFKASGARIRLPDEFITDLFAGVELSVLVDNYSNKQNTREFEGAISIFTEGEINRTELFEHVVRLLKGQYEHAKF